MFQNIGQKYTPDRIKTSQIDFFFKCEGGISSSEPGGARGTECTPWKKIDGENREGKGKIGKAKEGKKGKREDKKESKGNMERKGKKGERKTCK